MEHAWRSGAGWWLQLSSAVLNHLKSSLLGLFGGGNPTIFQLFCLAFLCAKPAMVETAVTFYRAERGSLVGVPFIGLSPQRLSMRHHLSRSPPASCRLSILGFLGVAIPLQVPDLTQPVTK